MEDSKKLTKKVETITYEKIKELTNGPKKQYDIREVLSLFR